MNIEYLNNECDKMLDKHWYKVAEAASIMSISGPAVLKRIKNGQMEHRMEGNKFYVSKESILEYLGSHPEKMKRLIGQSGNKAFREQYLLEEIERLKKIYALEWGNDVYSRHLLNDIGDKDAYVASNVLYNEALDEFTNYFSYLEKQKTFFKTSDASNALSSIRNLLNNKIDELQLVICRITSGKDMLTSIENAHGDNWELDDPDTYLHFLEGVIEEYRDSSIDALASYIDKQYNIFFEELKLFDDMLFDAASYKPNTMSLFEDVTRIKAALVDFWENGEEIEPDEISKIKKKMSIIYDCLTLIILLEHRSRIIKSNDKLKEDYNYGVKENEKRGNKGRALVYRQLISDIR